MQQGIHGVMVKQQQDMEKVKVDVQSFVASAMSGMEATVRQQQSLSEQTGQREPREERGSQLSDPKKT